MMKKRETMKMRRHGHGSIPVAWRLARGVAAVELALLLTPLTLLVFGVAEFGRAIYQYDTLTKSVRDAARLLSQYNPAGSAYPSAQAQCLAVYGNTGCTGSALAPGLTTSMVVICNPAGSSGCPGQTYLNVSVPNGGSVNFVEVRISGFTFTSVVPLVPSLANLTFGPISATMRQVL
jgi:Flp pilus assembly protein TadG